MSINIEHTISLPARRKVFNEKSHKNAEKIERYISKYEIIIYKKLVNYMKDGFLPVFDDMDFVNDKEDEAEPEAFDVER